MSEVHPTAARGFENAAELYERARPSYPAEAVEFMIDEMRLRGASTVVDLAAGTGKFTRELLARGIECVAVEPVAGMREQFERALPEAVVREGTAERMPFADGGVDAITIAQAFHWFANPSAVAEFARVLRTGGTLGLVWNVRDDRSDWVARTTEIYRRYEGADGIRVPRHRERGWQPVISTAAEFAPIATREFEYSQELTREGVVERLASVSFIAVLPDEEKAKAIGEVRALLDSHPDLRGRETIEHPYVTEVYLFGRR